MISVADALTMVLERAQPRTQPGSQWRTPLRDSLGRVLAEDIECTIDSPPHDKAQVDGYAVRAADVLAVGTTLQVVEEITAGQIPSQTVAPGTAIKIMTGAPIPAGADSVVMVECSESLADQNGKAVVRFTGSAIRPGQNIMRRGESMRRGEIVLRSGQPLRAIEIGLLAELGCPDVCVFRTPVVSVLATGNELVPEDKTPGPGQIRNSNGPMLQALTMEAGGAPINMGIARDTEGELADLIREGLDSDVLLLSGGVSAGVLDLVPLVLKKLGVREVFHKVNLKPGKPLWFGVFTDEKDWRSVSYDKLVFGLPGNPVSSFVCFQLFVRPAVARLAGRRGDGIRRVPALLAVDYQHRGDRATYYPGRAQEEHGRLIVEPLTWRGSADLRTLADANALIYFPPGSATFPAHSAITIHLLSDGICPRMIVSAVD